MDIKSLMLLNDFEITDMTQLEKTKELLYDLYELCRQNGLWILEKKISEVPPVLKLGIEAFQTFLPEKMDRSHMSVYFDDIMWNHVFVNKYRNEKLIEAMMLINGFNCILDGTSLEYLKKVLDSCTPC